MGWALLECFILLCYQLSHGTKEIQFQIVFKPDINDILSVIAMTVKDLSIFQF